MPFTREVATSSTLISSSAWADAELMESDADFAPAKTSAEHPAKIRRMIRQPPPRNQGHIGFFLGAGTRY